MASFRPLRALFAGARRRRYELLFCSLLLMLVATPLIETVHLRPLHSEMPLTICLLTAALGLRGRSWAKRTGVALALVIQPIRWLAASSTPPAITVAFTSFAFAVGVVATFDAIRYAVGARQIESEHMFAALSAYLLGGFMFAAVYAALEHTWPGSFGPGTFHSAGRLPLATASYFSFVTLTTLGYGDIVPRTELARGVVVVEALGAQIYLAVMVARLVSLFVQTGAQHGTDVSD